MPKGKRNRRKEKIVTSKEITKHKPLCDSRVGGGATTMGEEKREEQSGPVGEVEPTSVPRPEPMTSSQFLAWKQRKDEEAAAIKAEKAQKRAQDIATGAVQMNGRELFLHEPWVFDNELY